MANVFSTATLGLRLDTSTFNNAIKASGLTTQQAFASMSASAEQFRQKWDDATAGIKDTRRIISGILISQGFYGIMNAFTEGASAALTFSQNMETAAISTEYFVQGADKAAQSLAYLREMNTFAARTPFSTEAAIELSKYIQAVGISMNVSKSVLQVITDAAAATGATEETMQRIVFALGQMKTKGRIANEEIRQLANANVPIYEILQEELGLTGEQISNIGKEWISADKAIVAILNGLEKRYAGAADRIADTMSGMLDTVVDDAKIIAYEAGDGIYGTFEDILRTVRDKLDEYRDIATEFGAMGLFNEVLLDIDPTGQFGTHLLILVGNARQLIAALSDLMATSQPLINLFGNGLYGAIGTVTVGATALVKTIDGLEGLLADLGITTGNTGRMLGELYVMYQAGKWAFTLGQGALYAGQSLWQLGKATITSLIPSMAAGSQSVLGLVGSLATLAAAGVAVYAILNNLGGFGGLDISSGDILPSDYQSEMDRYMAEMKEYNDAIAKYQEQFNEPYTAIGEGTDKAIESYDDLKKASKSAAKSVQHDWVAAFDEVYQVPTFNDLSGGGATPELPELPDLGKLIGEITFSFPGIPGEELEKPEYDWDSVFEGDVFNGGWWKSILPGIITAGVIGAATHFAPKGLKGGGDIPTKPIGPSGEKLPSETTAAIKKLLAEYAAQANMMPTLMKEAQALLANGDPNHPGMYAATGVNSKSLIAVANKLDAANTRLNNIENKLIELGAKPTDLPAFKEQRQLALEAEKIELDIRDIKRELARRRDEAEKVRAEYGLSEYERAQNGIIKDERRLRQLEMRSEEIKRTPEGPINAYKQRARITASQLRELGITERIKEIEQQLKQSGDLSAGQIMELQQELKEARKELAGLLKQYDVAPRYASLTPEQFVTEFGKMGDKLADNMSYILKTKYAPNAVNDANAFSVGTVKLLQQQLEEFQHMGAFAEKYYSSTLCTLYDTTGTAQRVYAAVLENNNALKKTLNQLVKGTTSSAKPEDQPIVKLKDMAKKITELTDAAVEQRRIAAMQLEADARARTEAAKRDEERRIAEEKARRQALINDKNTDYSTKGTALDAATRADMAERLQHMVTNADIEKVSAKIDKIVDGEEGLAAILNTRGTTHTFVDNSGIRIEFDKNYSKAITEKLEAILDVLDDYEPGEISFTPKTTEALENILGIISGDTEEYYKRFEAYLNVPSKPVAPGTFDNLDIAKLIHTTVRDYLGYAPSGLLSSTPELLRERDASKFVISLGDIAGMLEGSGPFGTAAGTAARGLRLISDELLDGLSLRDASYATTVAGEITRQLGDLIKYSAGASLPSAGLNVYSGGLIKDAGVLLQVDAVAEGVVRGMSRTVPVQIIGVNGKVAEKIAKLASAPVGGVADIDAATLRALNKEAFYELGTLVNAFGKADQNSGLTSGLVAILNRDLSIRDTQYQKAFEARMGSTFDPDTGYRIFSPDAIMSYKNLHKERTAGLNAKELVADYMKQVVLPTFGFFPDLATGNMTETEAKRFAETIQDINKTAQQFNGSINALKDATSFYMVEYTKPQLNQISTAGNMAAGTNRHVQLLQDAYNTLGSTSELDRLLHSYAIFNANAGELAGTVLEVDFSAPIRQYTFLRQNANKWASDLLKTNVKFSSGKAISGSFISTVDGIMLEYFDALNNTAASGLTSAYSILSAQTKRKLLDVANNASKYFDLGTDAELAKRALTVLSENIKHIDPLSMNIRSYVDVISDINNAIRADLPVDELLRSKFDGFTRNTSNLIAQFNLGANEWIQGYVRDLSNMNEQLRRATNGTPISEIINKPLEAIMRIANASETADLAINQFGSLTGALDDAVKQIADSKLTGVIPRPVHSVKVPSTPSPTNFNIIDLETFGLPQATKAGTVYPEIFSGAMFNPATKEMDRFYTLPDDILKLINDYGANNAGVKNAVDSYINQIRSINKEFRDVYGKPGMTEEVISRGISKSAAIDKLLNWTTNPGGFTGYNATNLGRVGGGFDASVISAFTGTDVSKYALDDVMSQVTSVLRRYTGADTTLKLTELREMFGISDDMLKELYGISDAAAHTAQADVLATNEVLKRVLDGTLDSIANTGKEGGWRYVNTAGDNVTGIKDVLINIGKDINDAKLGDTVRQVADASDALDDAVQATVEVVKQAADAAADTAQAAAEAADKFRRATTAADLGDVAGAVGGARTAAVDDIGGPSLRNWITSRFGKLRDKILGRQTVDDFFNATDAAGDTYESRVFNQHLFGGRKKSAPTFNDLRQSFEDLRAADVKQYAEYGGQTMQDIRAAKNKADFAVAGGVSPDTAWVREAQELYDKALKQSYGDVADKFYKDVVNHINGQLKNTWQYNTFDDVLDALSDDTKLFVATFGSQFGILGDTLEITAKQLKNTAALTAFENLAKSGSFGKALKNSENITTAVGLLRDALNSIDDVSKAKKLVELAAYFGEVTGDAAAYAKTFGRVAEEFEQLKTGLKSLDEVSDITRKFVTNINKFGSNVAVMRSVPADVADAANDLLFAGRRASQAVGAAADTVSNSFKNLFTRAIDGVANFGLIDIAIAGVSAAIQHSVDEANKASLQASMMLRDKSGSVSKLADNGFEIGKVIGDDIYHGAAQEFGFAIASGVVGSLGTTAGMALGGKVGTAIGSALGTAVAPVIGTAIGSLVGAGIGIAVGAVSGLVADSAIEGLGGHSTTNLYLGDYLDALRDGSLITADALDEMCAAVGVTAEEIEELGQTAALAKHGVDVSELEELARNINTSTTMGSADYSKYFEKNDINRVLTGKNTYSDYKVEDVALRLAAAFGGIDSTAFKNVKTGGSSGTVDFLAAADGVDVAQLNKALAELNKYAGTELELRKVRINGVTADALVNTADNTLPNYSFEELEGLKEAVRLMYEQGNTTSSFSTIIGDVLSTNSELRRLIAESMTSGYSVMAAYNNLGGYLDLYNKAADTDYTLSDLSENWELGAAVQKFAAQYNEAGVDELLARLAQVADDAQLYNARPDVVDNSYFVRGEGMVQEYNPVPGSVLNGGQQTIWGADISRLLPGYLEEFSKLGINLTPGSVIGKTELSEPQEYDFTTITTDAALLSEAITGWRKDMSSAGLQNIDLSNLTITTQDAEILASAGIQINSDGTITFMKAEQENVTGSERQSDNLDPTVFSQYVLDKLKESSIEINFEAGELKFDPKEVGSNIYGAMFKLPDDWQKVAEPEVQKALEKLGHVMDSGYVMITDQSVINGEKTIEGFVSGLVGNSKMNAQVTSALRGIDELIQQEGATTVQNITEWADAITIPSPFKPEELNEDMMSMFEQMGIHFVEYGDEFLMQINQTGEHIKDGCVMLDADYWADLDEGLVAALEDMGVEVTTVGNQVMVDLSATMENGIGSIVSLYTERPDLWDQLPEGIKQALGAVLVETDNGMLELNNQMSSRLIEVGDSWILGWETIGTDTVATLRQNNTNVQGEIDDLVNITDNGIAEVVRVIEKEDIDTLLDNEIAVPFRSLPKDIQDALTGQEGWSETMRDGFVVVKQVEDEKLAEIVGAAQTGADNVGEAAGDIVTQIADAVRQAGVELNRLEQMQGMAGKSGGILGFGASANQVGTTYQGYLKDSGGNIRGAATTIYPIYNSAGDKIIKWGYYDENGVAHTTTIEPYRKRASGGPASGLTLTGELGTEMAILPDGTVHMLGANGMGELVDLPAGTKVLNAEDTEEILKYTGPITNVPKLAEGNTDLVIQQPTQEEDQVFKALMMTFMKSVIGQGTTNDAETDLAVTTDPMITVVDDAAKNLKEGNDVAIHGAVATIQETMTLYNGQQLTTLDNGFNNIIAAIAAIDESAAAKLTELLEKLEGYFTALNTTIVDGFSGVSKEHAEIVDAIKEARDTIVEAVKSIKISSSSSSGSGGSSGGGTYAGGSTYGTTGIGGTGFSLYGDDYYGAETDLGQLALEMAERGNWAGVMDALERRAKKIELLGTDYGNSNTDILNQAKELFDKRVTGSHDYSNNVRGYASVGSIQNALDEFDMRGYKISITGDDGGLSQQALWNEVLRGWTGMEYIDWLGMHDATGYNALDNYTPGMLDPEAPVITDAMDRNLKETARAIVDGQDVNTDNFMDFCDLLARSGYAEADKNTLEAIEAAHEDTVSITTALEALQHSFDNRTSGLNGTLEYLADRGMQSIYEHNNWGYKTEESGWSGVTSVDLAQDYHALMSQYAAAGNWDAFDYAAAQRDIKVAATGNNGGASTSSIAKDLEEKYKRNGSARGSLISEEGLYYAGEEGKEEAIIPLEQPDVLDKLGNAIGPYVDGNNVFDYTGNIEDASVVIKEGNEVAIHGAVAALLEANGTSDQTLIDSNLTIKDEIITAITENADKIVEAIGSLASKLSSLGSVSKTAATQQQTSSGGGTPSRPTPYVPSVKVPTVIYDSNTDYHALMNEYAAAGNWSAFDTAAQQREAKMAADGSLSKWEATDTLKEQLQNLYKRHGSANGSIISEEGLYYAGEKDKQEAIIPLEQPEALNKVGAAIGEYVGPNQYDYTEDIDNASEVIKEGNEVAIHGAVAALLEAETNSNSELFELLTAHKDEIIAALKELGTSISSSFDTALSKLSSSMGAANKTTTQQAQSGSSGGGTPGRPTPYVPSVKVPTVIYDSNTDYHALMDKYAAEGNWSAFDTAAAQREAKMAADSSLSKWEATDTLKEQLQDLYKRHGSAKGSIINEEGLYYAGEKDKQEAIIPLEDPQALDSVGKAIGQYTDFQTPFIDYSGNIDDASIVIKEGNEVAIHGAVAALLEGMVTDRDSLTTLITTSKEEIIAAINGVATQITGSLSEAISKMSASNAAAAASNTQQASSGYTGGGGSSTTYRPSVKTPSSTVIYDSNTDYHALMDKYAAEGNWSAFDTAAAQREAKMAADSSLSKWNTTSDIRKELEEQYKRKGSAMGSLISTPGLYYAGEMGLDEAIVPLEQPSVLRKVGASIASFMPVNLQQQMGAAQGLQNAGIGTTTTYAPQLAMDPTVASASMIQSVLESVLPQIANVQAEGNNEDKRPLYVGTLVADERGLKQLERKLYDIRQVEAGRR